jgi:hypothetical protein
MTENIDPEKLEAWANQSKSLIEVQKFGGSLEGKIRTLLGWNGGRLIYDISNGYSIEVDAVVPSVSTPETIVSVTYTKPDTPGHSNENKLHLKLGELALAKCAYPKTRVVLVIGGTGEAWLKYVLKAFNYFFDEVILLWEPSSARRLKDIRDNPLSVQLRNTQLWDDLRNEWSRTALSPVGQNIPSGLVRYAIADILRAQSPKVHHPNMIHNEVARLCMQRSQHYGGAEWRSYLEDKWANIEMSRNYFNPVEASVELSIGSAGIKFQGGVAQDVKLPSLLNAMGMVETSLSEDFMLYSQKLRLPVYLQCKASGGGRRQHGKNIQNRAKEQIARSILYRCNWEEGSIVLAPKNFHWIGVLDGDWGVSRRQPSKYVHMLQWAGYDKIFEAASLLDSNLNVKRGSKNPLINYLTSTLDCELA